MSRQTFADIGAAIPDAVYLQATGEINNQGSNSGFGQYLAAIPAAPAIQVNGSKAAHGGRGEMLESQSIQPFLHPISDQSFTIAGYFAFPRFPTAGENPLIGIIGNGQQSLYFNASAGANAYLRAYHGNGSSTSSFATFNNIPKFLSQSGRNLVFAAIGRDASNGGKTFAFVNGKYIEGPNDTNDYNFASGDLLLSGVGNRQISIQQQAWLRALPESELNQYFNRGFGTWIE